METEFRPILIDTDSLPERSDIVFHFRCMNCSLEVYKVSVDEGKCPECKEAMDVICYGFDPDKLKFICSIKHKEKVNGN